MANELTQFNSNSMTVQGDAHVESPEDRPTTIQGVLDNLSALAVDLYKESCSDLESYNEHEGDICKRLRDIVYKRTHEKTGYIEDYEAPISDEYAEEIYEHVEDYIRCLDFSKDVTPGILQEATRAENNQELFSCYLESAPKEGEHGEHFDDYDDFDGEDCDALDSSDPDELRF